MTKPIDPNRTNSGQLIVKGVKREREKGEEEREREREREREGFCHHVQSDKMFRMYMGEQERFVERKAKKPKLEKEE